MILSCLIAKRFPIRIVRIERTKIILYHVSASGLNTECRTDTNTKITEPFEITERKEVTAIGAPS